MLFPHSLAIPELRG